MVIKIIDSHISVAKCRESCGKLPRILWQSAESLVAKMIIYHGIINKLTGSILGPRQKLPRVSN